MLLEGWGAYGFKGRFDYPGMGRCTGKTRLCIGCVRTTNEF